MRYPRILLLGLLALAALAYGAAAQGTTPFSVDSTTDAVDANPGDGACDDGAGSCTLRAAIQETNALSGADTINLPASVYRLSIPGTEEDAAVTGDLDITDDLTITGAGQDDTIIDGGNLDRVIETVGSVTVDISGVTIRNGGTASYFHDHESDSGFGGGILNGGEATLTLTDATVRGNWASHGGGGIDNDWPSGNLTLINSTVSDNIGGVAVEASGGGGISNGGTATLIDSIVSGNRADLSGGGIQSGGTLTVDRSTVNDNTVSLFVGGGICGGGTVTVTNSTISGNTVGIDGFPDRGEGGGIYMFGVATITNSTISDNTANAFGGGIANDIGSLTLTNVTVSGNSAGTNGGGIANGNRDASARPATLTLTNVTISGNSAGSNGGGIFNNPGNPVTLENAIVANSRTGDNCAGPITSGGHNLEDADTCGLTGPGNLPNGEPHLLPLADNGGPTRTHALLGGSPAIDAGDDSICPETDQRGVARPVDGNTDGVAVCDVGAYEAPAGTTIPTPTPTPTPVATATPSPAATPTVAAAQLPETGGAPGGSGDGTAAAAGAVLLIAGIASVSGALALRGQAG